MEDYCEKRKGQSKESINVERIQKFKVKTHQNLITKKFHQPFNTKKSCEGQKSRKVVAKLKSSVGKFLLQYNPEKVPWRR